jgi:hypothetical protein
MKTRGQFVVSDTKGEFFLTELSLDGRMYLDRNDKWVVSTGILIYRWPGMYETLDTKAAKMALKRYEAEIKEMDKDELLKKIEKAFPLKKWLQKDEVAALQEREGHTVE